LQHLQFLLFLVQFQLHQSILLRFFLFGSQDSRFGALLLQRQEPLLQLFVFADQLARLALTPRTAQIRLLLPLVQLGLERSRPLPPKEQLAVLLPQPRCHLLPVPRPRPQLFRELSELPVSAPVLLDVDDALVLPVQLQVQQALQTLALSEVGAQLDLRLLQLGRLQVAFQQGVLSLQLLLALLQLPQPPLQPDLEGLLRLMSLHLRRTWSASRGPPRPGPRLSCLSD